MCVCVCVCARMRVFELPPLGQAGSKCPRVQRSCQSQQPIAGLQQPVFALQESKDPTADSECSCPGLQQATLICAPPLRLTAAAAAAAYYDQQQKQWTCGPGQQMGMMAPTGAGGSLQAGWLRKWRRGVSPSSPWTAAPAPAEGNSAIASPAPHRQQAVRHAHARPPARPPARTHARSQANNPARLR